MDVGGALYSLASDLSDGGGQMAGETGALSHHHPSTSYGKESLFFFGPPLVGLKDKSAGVIFLLS